MAKRTAEATERKAPERMGGFDDGRLAEAITLKLVKLITPIQSRPNFKEVRAGLFAIIAKLQSIQTEPETGE
jgi:hypothetical protein